MSTHPLSLYKQIIYKFPEVIDARFEYQNYSIIIYLKLSIPNNEDSNDIKARISKYVNDHRGITDNYIIKTNWIDGPKYPEIFNKLDKYEFSLIESCSCTGDEIERLLYKVYCFIKKIYIKTIKVGVVGIDFLPIDNYMVSQNKLNQMQLFCELLFPPGVKVIITVLENEVVMQRNKFSFLKGQPTKIEIKNPQILSLYEEGEDLFRKSLDINFGYDTFSDIYDVNNNSSSIVLPQLYNQIDLRTLLPFYEKIFFYVPFSDVQSDVNLDNIYSCSYSEILKLIERNRIVPIFSQNYPRYNEKTILDFCERGKYISPQHLSSLLASDYIKQNPLWLVGQEEFLLVKYFLDDLRKKINLNENKINIRSLDLFNQWIDFQIDGVVDFSRLLINQGSLIPIYFGWGAFLSKILKLMFPNKNIPDLELQFGGMEIAHSSALNSTCYPMRPQNIKMYEILSSFHSNAVSKDTNEFPLLLNLKEILSSIEITCPENISIIEWDELIQKSDIVNLRNILKKYFSNVSVNDIDKINDIALTIKNELQILSSRLSSYKSLVSNFDILSPVTELILTCNNMNIPLLGWIIGLYLKYNMPQIWDSLELNPNLEEIKKIITSIGTLKNPRIVTLYKIKNNITK